jgi:hypothetical protein
MNERHALAHATVTALLLLCGACSSTSSTTATPLGDAGSDAAPASGGDAAAKGQIGDPCPAGSSDCAAGLECAGEDPGGGQCFKTCAPSTDSDCGDTTKYACSDEGHCYLRCTSNADCKRAGYACKDDTPPRPPVKFCDVP